MRKLLKPAAIVVVVLGLIIGGLRLGYGQAFSYTVQDKWFDIVDWCEAYQHRSALTGTFARHNRADPVGQIVAYKWEAVRSEENPANRQTTLLIAYQLTSSRAQDAGIPTEDFLKYVISDMLWIWNEAMQHADYVSFWIVSEVTVEPRSGNAVWQVDEMYAFPRDDLIRVVSAAQDLGIEREVFVDFLMEHFNQGYAVYRAWFGLRVYLSQQGLVWLDVDYCETCG